jgi:KAP family P-loop domain
VLWWGERLCGLSVPLHSTNLQSLCLLARDGEGAVQDVAGGWSVAAFGGREAEPLWRPSLPAGPERGAWTGASIDFNWLLLHCGKDLRFKRPNSTTKNNEHIFTANLRCGMKLLGQGVEAAVAAQNDMFGRDAFAAGLLRLTSQSQDPLVIALDEKWGTGKTVFARRLVGQAEAQNHTVVYFDAFRRDYSSDVFIALSAALLEKLPKTNKTKTMKESAKTVVKTVGRLALKGLVRAGTAGAVNASDLNDAFADTADDIGDLAEAELDKLIDERLSGAKKEEEAFAKFRKSLMELTEAQAGIESASKPILFIIDELDRCRPDYALDVLETIKHFFSVPKVHFLLVCDFDQLVASVKARYGLESEGEIYLEKFVDARVTFPVQDKDAQFNSISKFIQGSIDGMPDDGEGGQQWTGLSNFISRIGHRLDYSLRRIERIITQFALCMNFTKPNQFRLGAVIYVLCDLKISNRSLFQKAKNGTLKYKDLREFYRFDEERDNWYISWLQYYYDDEINREEQEWQELRRSLYKYHLSGHQETALYLANQVVDRLSIN